MSTSDSWKLALIAHLKESNTQCGIDANADLGELSNLREKAEQMSCSASQNDTELWEELTKVAINCGRNTGRAELAAEIITLLAQWEKNG